MEESFPEGRFTTNITALRVRVFRNVAFRAAPLRIADSEFPAILENRIKIVWPRLLKRNDSEFMPIVPYPDGSWAHCLQDVLPIIATLRLYLIDRPHIKLLIHSPGFDVGQILERLGIANPVEFMTSRPVSCSRLHEVSFSPNATVHFWPACMFREFSKALRLRPDSKQNIILISRSDVSTRRIENEEELEAELRREAELRGLNFLKFNKDLFPLSEAMQIFRSAALIVAPHGGANYHAMFAQAGTVFIEFCMAKEMHTLANVALSLDMRYWIVPIDENKDCASFVAPIGKVRRIIESGVQPD